MTCAAKYMLIDFDVSFLLCGSGSEASYRTHPTSHELTSSAMSRALISSSGHKLSVSNSFTL